MKKLSESRTPALTVLIIVALIAVPLFGGIGLKTAERSAAKAFSSVACKPDQHGNDLFSDTDRLIVAARSLLSEGKALSKDSGSEFENRASALETAIDVCSKQKNAIERYTSYETLYLAAKQFYNGVKGNASSEIESFMTEVESQAKRIDRSYRTEYTEYLNKCSELTASWPASSIAKLWNIGG
ncbi:MAG: hypothetical protein IKZ82_04960 [Clostridia bacterium]|nr:hypothetical protein [Clostridia bacterium]